MQRLRQQVVEAEQILTRRAAEVAAKDTQLRSHAKAQALQDCLDARAA